MLQTVTKAELGITGFPVPRQYMQPGEEAVLLKLVASVKPRRMVEIGVNVGLTAKAVLREVKSITRYVGVDVGPEYQFEIPEQTSERPVNPGLLVRNDTRFELRLRGADLPLWTDVVFIDGDHGRKAVIKDTRWATGATSIGGMIIWHDYGNPSVQVTGVLDELKQQGRDIVHVAGTWLAFEKR